jgi:hypothetical protein
MNLANRKRKSVVLAQPHPDCAIANPARPSNETLSLRGNRTNVLAAPAQPESSHLQQVFFRDMFALRVKKGKYEDVGGFKPPIPREEVFEVKRILSQRLKPWATGR